MRDAKEDRHKDSELFDEIYKMICDVVCRKQNIMINGEIYPYEDVRTRFLELDGMHVEYVMFCMKQVTSKIKNIRAYLIAALYNAPSTINYYYQQSVQYDMFNQTWKNNASGHGVQKQEGG